MSAEEKNSFHPADRSCSHGAFLTSEDLQTVMDEESPFHIVDKVPSAVQSDSVQPGRSAPNVVMYNSLQSSLYVVKYLVGRV
ncbi:hypothetical protein N7455_006056 [Penicillium solitum]|uniref:uncharacterized protein n=1 Tax=Penicillium solitum TaxID=60172 RepID=UPI0032C4190E|nr:hypothetical protein N7455_006056 [Penicillium solitum]